MKSKKKQPILRQVVNENKQANLPESAKWMIVIACILFDCVCFYTTYSLLLRQSLLLNIFTVCISAVTMDLFPVVLGMLLSRAEKDRMEIGMAISIAIAFLCEAVMSFFIRYNTKSALFESGGLGLSLSGEAAQNIIETTPIETNNAQIGVVVLLGILPILTSLLSFAVSYQNPKRKRIELDEQQLLNLKEKINEHKVNIELLENELSRRDLYKLDKTRFAVADLLINLTEIGSNIKVSQEIASVLQDVDATTILTEDSEIQYKIEEAKKLLNKIIEETDYNEEEESLKYEKEN
ncbi:MAG: hypothetical protein IKJ01_05400 [Lachnospiraceae bacterium]|nr:hypothetical protein [Lachnospiraceae bacterium]